MGGAPKQVFPAIDRRMTCHDDQAGLISPRSSNDYLRRFPRFGIRCDSEVSHAQPRGHVFEMCLHRTGIFAISACLE